MMRTGLRLLNTHSAETAMIGDRMDTDIVAGIETGLDPILVLSGVTTRAMMANTLPPPPCAERGGRYCAGHALMPGSSRNKRPRARQCLACRRFIYVRTQRRVPVISSRAGRLCAACPMPVHRQSPQGRPPEALRTKSGLAPSPVFTMPPPGGSFRFVNSAAAVPPAGWCRFPLSGLWHSRLRLPPALPHGMAHAAGQALCLHAFAVFQRKTGHAVVEGHASISAVDRGVAEGDGEVERTAFIALGALHLLFHTQPAQGHVFHREACPGVSAVNHLAIAVRQGHFLHGIGDKAAVCIILRQAGEGVAPGVVLPRHAAHKALPQAGRSGFFCLARPGCQKLAALRVRRTRAASAPFAYSAMSTLAGRMPAALPLSVHSFFTGISITSVFFSA